MKKFIFVAMAGLVLSTSAQTTAEKVNKVYDSRIQQREVKATDGKLLQHEAKLITVEANKLVQDEQQEAGLPSLLKTAQRAAFRATDDHQRLDSIIVYSGKGDTGAPQSKQEFTYNEVGMPLHCYNYYPDQETGFGWTEVGEYLYEYDEQDRLICATSLNDYGYYSYGEKYEYIYDEDGKPYTMQIYYYQEGGDWMPMQYAEYEYDEMNRTTMEAYYYTENLGETWVGQSKKTATYDDQDRMTSYFEYNWDYSTNDWVGNNSFGGQNYYYRADGQDDWIESFYWENGQWSNYCREYFTYNDQNQLTRHEYCYWNRANQDWLGGDLWGQWGYQENNSKVENTYDEKGRCILEMNFNYDRNTDEFTSNFKRTRDFTEQDNERLLNEEKVYYTTGPNEFFLYNHRTIITNRHGAEVYFLNRNFVGTDMPLRKTDEQVRDIDDLTNRYNSGYFYAYTQDEANTRYGETYEYCLYDEDDNVITTHHMRGTGTHTDTEWVEYDDFSFRYVKDAQGNSVRVGYDGIQYDNGQWIPINGYDNEYDFTVDRADVYIWPATNMSDNFYLYKPLQEYSYAYYSWSNTMMESTNVYYYSGGDNQGTGIDEVVAKPIATGDVQYFDIQGHQVSADARGIIIVRDANGNAYKIIK